MDPDQEGIDPSYDPAVFDVDGGAANGVNGGLQNERSASEPAVNDKADTTEKTPDKKKKKKNGVTSTLERRRKGKSLSQEEKHEKEGREKDKESEGDSGIAVVEHSVSRRRNGRRIFDVCIAICTIRLHCRADMLLWVSLREKGV